LQVKAQGSPDVPLGWIFDLHLSMAKLLGRLCGATLDVRKGEERMLLEEGTNCAIKV
jgi:hypothetical protein